jgi:hypothetical protein
MLPYGETWHERKLQRSIDYWRSHGIGLNTCTACSGSGRYDRHGSPACGACDGTGKTRGNLRSVEDAVVCIATLQQMRSQRREAVSCRKS